MLSLTNETVHTKYCLALTVFPDLLKPWDRLRSSGSKGTEMNRAPTMCQFLKRCFTCIISQSPRPPDTLWPSTGQHSWRRLGLNKRVLSEGHSSSRALDHCSGHSGLLFPALLRDEGVEWRLSSEATVLCFSKKQLPILGLVTGTTWPLASQPPCGEATAFGS